MATKNPGKFKEFAFLMRGQPFDLMSLNDYDNIEIVEDGLSFDENAAKKAKVTAEKTGNLALADDSGLEVLALDGRPGVHTARYAGEQASDDDNIRKLLTEMKGIPWERRQAQFVCSLALAYPGGKVVVVRGYLRGLIAPSPQGIGGFGYDPVFFLEDRCSTLAELGQEEKNAISHRAKAFEAMLEHLIVEVEVEGD